MSVFRVVGGNLFLLKILIEPSESKQWEPGQAPHSTPAVFACVPQKGS